MYLSACSTGYCTVSCSSRLTSSRPPTSSQETSGTSTWFSRRELGCTTPRAWSKCFFCTRMESRILRSTRSASKSMYPILLRMHSSAASMHSCWTSAPTYPWMFLAMASRSTSSSSRMSRVLIFSISSRPLSSGTPMSSSRSNRPGRRRAESSVCGRLVAPMTTTRLVGRSPSMRVSSWLTTRFSVSPPAFSRLGAMESISSMKMMAPP
mmetsp:Transcript_30993/g.70891  ORF Transcript_30993/g.70891 Transcript_30993/m.70891 type:complete len:209 (+) Transcript_30993:951-1577(+)